MCVAILPIAVFAADALETLTVLANAFAMVILAVETVIVFAVLDVAPTKTPIDAPNTFLPLN